MPKLARGGDIQRVYKKIYEKSHRDNGHRMINAAPLLTSRSERIYKEQKHKDKKKKSLEGYNKGAGWMRSLHQQLGRGGL